MSHWDEDVEVRGNLNLCGNANLHQFLMLIEKLSEKFPNKLGNKFTWASCFDSNSDNRTCPLILKNKLQKYPQEAMLLVKVLKREHFGYINPAYVLARILKIFGHVLSVTFDARFLLDPVKEEQFYNEL